MARLSSNLVDFHRFRPCFQIPQPPQIIANPLQHPSKTQKFKTLASQTNPDSDASSTTEKLVVEPSNYKGTGSKFPGKDINKKIAIVSILAALGLFLSSRLDCDVSLKDLSALALPYEEVFQARFTVAEFCVDGSEVCRELAPEMYQVEQQYQVNFVMLNVDNTKWQQELDAFGVEGIPRFASFDKKMGSQFTTHN